MTEAAIIEAINLALAALPRVIQAGMDVAPLAKNIYDTFAGKTTVTQADLDAMVIKSKELEDEIMAPLPEGD